MIPAVYQPVYCECRKQPLFFSKIEHLLWNRQVHESLFDYYFFNIKEEYFVF
jgi:hypothetical protein